LSVRCQEAGGRKKAPLSVLLISCVFWIFFQTAGSQLCFRFFLKPRLYRQHEKRQLLRCKLRTIKLSNSWYRWCRATRSTTPWSCLMPDFDAGGFPLCSFCCRSFKKIPFSSAWVGSAMSRFHGDTGSNAIGCMRRW